MRTMLYVGGLPPEATSADLEKLFTPHGTVVRVRIVPCQDTSPASAYGLVSMATKEAAMRALEAMSSLERDGRRLTVVHLNDETIATLGIVGDF